MLSEDGIISFWDGWKKGMLKNLETSCKRRVCLSEEKEFYSEVVYVSKRNQESFVKMLRKVFLMIELRILIWTLFDWLLGYLNKAMQFHAFVLYVNDIEKMSRTQIGGVEKEKKIERDSWPLEIFWELTSVP